MGGSGGTVRPLRFLRLWEVDVAVGAVAITVAVAATEEMEALSEGKALICAAKLGMMETIVLLAPAGMGRQEGSP